LRTQFWSCRPFVFRRFVVVDVLLLSTFQYSMFCNSTRIRSLENPNRCDEVTGRNWISSNQCLFTGGFFIKPNNNTKHCLKFVLKIQANIQEGPTLGFYTGFLYRAFGSQLLFCIDIKIRFPRYFRLKASYFSLWAQYDIFVFSCKE
jgi:hypothetical protein